MISRISELILMRFLFGDGHLNKMDLMIIINRSKGKKALPEVSSKNKLSGRAATC